MHHKIGIIIYMHTYRRSSNTNNTTSCFIQLENWKKHSLLAETLNQLEFHGTQLRAEETSFNFQFDDIEYSPKGIGCSLCTHSIITSEIKTNTRLKIVIKQAITEAINIITYLFVFIKNNNSNTFI
jgi:hypothetical protein